MMHSALWTCMPNLTCIIEVYSVLTSRRFVNQLSQFPRSLQGHRWQDAMTPFGA